MPDAPRRLAYVRVSTDHQVESGLSIEAATQQVHDYWRHTLQPLGVAAGQVYVEEGVSASRRRFLDRPQGKRLDACARRGDHIVINRLDRAFRSLSDFAHTMDRWRRRGVYVHLLDIGVATSTPVGELIAGILAVVAQWESRRQGERIRDALLVRRAQGRATNGTPPIGYRKIAGRRIVADQRERRIGRLILRLRAEGWTWRDIAGELNRRKIPTRPRQLKGGRVSKVRVPWRLDAVIRWGQAAAAGFPRIGITTQPHQYGDHHAGRTTRR